LSKHTIYNVKGSDHLGTFDVYRRYNDFHTLRDYMVLKWPCMLIPPIPVIEYIQPLYPIYTTPSYNPFILNRKNRWDRAMTN
jgi:hypothetical protein